jgi:CRISPR-associated protein Csm4
MKQSIVRFRFHSPLHLAKGLSDMDSSFHILHSDTLKSAIFSCALELYGEESIAPNAVESKRFFEAFQVSSAFPFNQGEYFLPKPDGLPAQFAPQLLHAGDPEDYKTGKKIQFLGLGIWSNVVQGQIAPFDKKHLSPNGAFLSVSEMGNNVFKPEEVQRVMIPRAYAEGTDTNTFYMERLYFEDGAGLFSLIKYDESVYPGIQQKVEAAIRLLGDNGLGSDRTTGNGLFEPEFGLYIDLPEVSNPTHQMALALYCPSKSSKIVLVSALPNSAYQLVKRGGYFANLADQALGTFRKNAVYMFLEGSVFALANAPEGSIVDLKPKQIAPTILDHPVWRDGSGFFFPVHLPHLNEPITTFL